jgi:hypothetical protein
MSGFTSTAVTLSEPAARATSTSEPPPGPMMSVFGLSGATLNGSARYQSRIPTTLAALPSHSRTFVHASESM